jgi:hypothetical protein
MISNFCEIQVSLKAQSIDKKLENKDKQTVIKEDNNSIGIKTKKWINDYELWSLIINTINENVDYFETDFESKFVLLSNKMTENGFNQLEENVIERNFIKFHGIYVDVN